MQACEHIVANQELEARKLTAIASEAEAEFSRQKKELDAVRSERTLLLQQLEKRDLELTELYGKLQAQKSVLANGAATFAKRAAERDTLAAKVATRKGELLLMTTQLSDTRALELECTKLESDLQREKAKIRSLTEELERPINIHRWRALEDRDPDKWALIQRAHSLQRRVIEARSELKVRDDALRAAETEYAELRAHLAKLPSRSASEDSEAIERLNANIKAKARQAKGLEADLEAQRALVDDYKRELRRFEEAMERLAVAYCDRRRAQNPAAARRRQTSAGGAGSTLGHAAALAVASMNRSMDDMALGFLPSAAAAAAAGLAVGAGVGGAQSKGGGIAEADRLLALYDAQLEERKKADEESKS
jgi:chromosome segregation ATPase